MAIITSIDCTLPRPDITTLQQNLKTEFSQRLLGGAPVLPMSAEDVLSFVMAGTVNLMHGFVTQALKENDPATMCCDNLIIYGAQHGINLQASTRAKGYVAITGDSETETVIPPNIRFVGASSREYKLDPEVQFNPKTMVGGGAVLRVTATLAGPEYNLGAGEPLTVSTTFPGIDTEATVVGNGITGGTANETCDAFRVRVIAAEAAGVITTNLNWYLQQSAHYPGVTRVCSDECEGCCDPSYVGLYPFMEGVYGDADEAPYGVPPAAVLDAMTLWMFGAAPGKGQGLAPVGMSGRFLPALPTVMDVTVTCFKGCPGADDRITTALQAFLRASYCVGSRICKEQVRAACYRAIGLDPCFSQIVLTFDESIGREDNAYAYLDCGHFVVLGTVTVTQAPV